MLQSKLSPGDNSFHTWRVKADDMVILGVAGKVLALFKASGEIAWTSDIPGRGFVNLISDGERVFAHAGGELHCLDFNTGQLLWTNKLQGCGYSVATLCFANGAVTPNGAAVQDFLETQRRSANSSTTTPSVH